MAAIFIATTFALSGLGVAFASWTDTITIDGTVTTGSLCWEFASATILDNAPPENYGGDYPVPEHLADYTCNTGFADQYFWRLDKNVAWGTVFRQDLDLDGYYETLEVTLNNVYPCNFNMVSFYVNNYGTIPLKVDHVVINDVSYYSNIPHVTFDLSGNDVDDFEIEWKDNFGYQMEPGTSSPEFSFWLHTLQDEGEGVQGQSFTFTISIVAIQWNEYPSVP